MGSEGRSNFNARRGTKGKADGKKQQPAINKQHFTINKSDFATIQEVLAETVT